MCARRLKSLGTALVLAASVGACSASEPPVTVAPAIVEEVSGDVLPRVTLTASAAERLAIATDTVSIDGDGFRVPSAAVIITADGKYWVYANPEPLVYLRTEISPVIEEGGQAFFANGPAAGSAVVIAGVPELYGAEFGVGK